VGIAGLEAKLAKSLFSPHRQNLYHIQTPRGSAWSPSAQSSLLLLVSNSSAMGVRLSIW